MSDTPAAPPEVPPAGDRPSRPHGLKGYVTMGLHKLTAGSGYDYLTRQVAALDVTEKGHVGLAAYYAERGESPGVWVGSGMDGIAGLDAGDAVTSEQMRNLFGHGLHPLADAGAQHVDGATITLDVSREDDAARCPVPGGRWGDAVSGQGGEAVR